MKIRAWSKRNWGESFLKLVLGCCSLGPELLRASLIYTGAQRLSLGPEARRFGAGFGGVHHSKDQDLKWKLNPIL